jgi:hypothetical protein
MSHDFIFSIKNPGPRPAYYLIAEHLWGAGCNIDSDGNSRTPGDTHWTELTLSLRGESSVRIDIDPLPIDPLVLAVRSTQESLCRQAAQFIVNYSGGALEKIV